MAIRILSLAKFLELSPADHLTFLEAARREIDQNIAQLHAGPIRDDRPRSYYLRLCSARRRRLAQLAQAAGHGKMPNAA